MLKLKNWANANYYALDNSNFFLEDLSPFKKRSLNYRSGTGVSSCHSDLVLLPNLFYWDLSQFGVSEYSQLTLSDESESPVRSGI